MGLFRGPRLSSGYGCRDPVCRGCELVAASRLSLREQLHSAGGPGFGQGARGGSGGFGGVTLFLLSPRPQNLENKVSLSSTREPTALGLTGAAGPQTPQQEPPGVDKASG